MELQHSDFRKAAGYSIKITNLQEGRLTQIIMPRQKQKRSSF